MFYRFAGNGDNPFDEGLVFDNGLIDSQDGTNILHDGSYGNGQGAGWHGTSCYGLDELLLTPLRVFDL